MYLRLNACNDHYHMPYGNYRYSKVLISYSATRYNIILC